MSFEAIPRPTDKNLVNVCQILKRNQDVLVGARGSTSTLEKAFLLQDAKATKAADVTIKSTRSGTEEVSVEVPADRANAPFTKEANADALNVDFGIPSWVTHIIIGFVGVSSSVAIHPGIRVGDDNGIFTSGYIAGSSSGTTGVGSDTYTNRFGIRSGAASTVLHGAVHLTAANRARTLWVANGNLTNSSLGSFYTVSGHVQLTSALKSVRVTSVTGVFDAGALSMRAA